MLREEAFQKSFRICGDGILCGHFGDVEGGCASPTGLVAVFLRRSTWKVFVAPLRRGLLCIRCRLLADGRTPCTLNFFAELLFIKHGGDQL